MATILAIESSCDETSVAIIRNGKLLSNAVATQIAMHRKYGGVMPEVASRLHNENIVIVLSEALKEAKIKLDDVDAVVKNPYKIGTIESDLYNKIWIDTVQWHLEDIIRNPRIDAADALNLKRRIDRSNQDRTDLVERIDSYFYEKFSNVTPQKGAKINTESPAWAVDRLSILHVKLFHMRAEVTRCDATEEHLAKCNTKLKILEEQISVRRFITSSFSTHL